MKSIVLILAASFFLPISASAEEVTYADTMNIVVKWDKSVHRYGYFPEPILRDAKVILAEDFDIIEMGQVYNITVYPGTNYQRRLRLRPVEQILPKRKSWRLRIAYFCFGFTFQGIGWLTAEKGGTSGAKYAGIAIGAVGLWPQKEAVFNSRIMEPGEMRVNIVKLEF